MGPSHSTEPGLTLQGNSIRALLSFDVDLDALAQRLEADGHTVERYPASTGPALGWGRFTDAEGYYPYWIDRTDAGWCFSFPPEDYVFTAAGASPVAGAAAQREFQRWLPVLRGASPGQGPKRR